MQFAPAEQVRQALSYQGKAHEMLAEAKKEMEVAQALIRELEKAHGRRFICGGELFTINERGCDGKWAYGRSQLEKDENTPVIDRLNPVPPFPHESLIPTERANAFKENLKKMNEGPKQISFGEAPRVDDTEDSIVRDECETQDTPRIGDSCY